MFFWRKACPKKKAQWKRVCKSEWKDELFAIKKYLIIFTKIIFHALNFIAQHFIAHSVSFMNKRCNRKSFCIKIRSTHCRLIAIERERLICKARSKKCKSFSASGVVKVGGRDFFSKNSVFWAWLTSVNMLAHVWRKLYAN